MGALNAIMETKVFGGVELARIHSQWKRTMNSIEAQQGTFQHAIQQNNLNRVLTLLYGYRYDLCDYQAALEGFSSSESTLNPS